MTEVQTLLCILGLALITLITRAFFFMSEQQWRLPALIERGLQFAPIAALSAVIFPEIFLWEDHFSGLLMNSKIYGGVAGAAFFILKRGQGHAVFGTIVVGMLTYLPLHLILGWN